MDSFLTITVFIFGLLIGSFYNVVGCRLPNNENIAFPASHCPKCNHKLKFYELIPVISYIFLRGKCLKCKERISLIYPFFELLTAILFTLCYKVFGLNINFVISIVFVSTLIIISISDLRYFIIPDEVLIVGILLMLILFLINCFTNHINIMDGLIYKLLNGLGSFTLMYLFKIIGDNMFKKESLGGGDIKLMFLIGLLLGFNSSILTLFIAAVIALPLSIFSLIKSDNNVIPFGPYLSGAAVIILLTKIDMNTVLTLFTK